MSPQANSLDHFWQQHGCFLCSGNEDDVVRLGVLYLICELEEYAEIEGMRKDISATKFLPSTKSSDGSYLCIETCLQLAQKFTWKRSATRVTDASLTFNLTHGFSEERAQQNRLVEIQAKNRVSIRPKRASEFEESSAKMRTKSVPRCRIKSAVP